MINRPSTTDSEYTPETWQVRARYVAQSPEGVSGPQFDRWLNNLMAETWHEGACNYYDANPYGTQAKDA